jgi:hypothetical protein
MGALDFMKKKETLQTAYEALAKLGSGPNSLATQLEKQLAMLPNGVTVQLEKDTAQIQANFKLVVEKVAAAVIDNAGLKKIERDIVAADQKYSDILKEFNEGSAELSEHLDAATFLCDKKKGHDRLSAGKQRYEKNKVEIQTRFICVNLLLQHISIIYFKYVVTFLVLNCIACTLEFHCGLNVIFVLKVVGMLTSGSFGKNFGKALGALIFEQNTMSATTDAETVAKLTSLFGLEVDYPPPPMGSPFKFTEASAVPFGVWKTMVDGIADKLPGKQLELDTGMKANALWSSCQTKIEGDFSKASDFADWLGYGLEHADDPGACLWLTTAKLNSFRHGPKSIPMPGFACMLQAVTPIGLWFYCLPVEPIISQGIVLRDIASFLESASGIAIFLEHGKIFELREGEVAVVPFGWVAMPLYLRPELDTQKKRKSVVPWAMFVTLTLYSKFSAQALSSAAWTQVQNHNNDHLGRKADHDPLWGSRKKLFDAFSAGVIA